MVCLVMHGMIGAPQNCADVNNGLRLMEGEVLVQVCHRCTVGAISHTPDYYKYSEYVFSEYQVPCTLYCTCTPKDIGVEMFERYCTWTFYWSTIIQVSSIISSNTPTPPRKREKDYRQD